MSRLFPCLRTDILVFIIYSVFFLDTVLVLCERKTVNCAVGRITGLTKTVEIGPPRRPNIYRPVQTGPPNTVNITEFLGIPYAEPPIGENRFRKPVKKGYFQDELLAFTFGASCPQFNPLFIPNTMSEDCLFLNVYTPVALESHSTPEKSNITTGRLEEPLNPEEANITTSGSEEPPNPEEANITSSRLEGPLNPEEANNTTSRPEELPNPEKTRLLPVMIWIHGGGFIIGDGSIFDGGRLAAYGQVVVVTLNYRLGPFGFLNAGDPTMNGNNGLRDQQLAITWVNENIECFGGDKSMVTIFGESSGAAAVMYQMIYPPNNQFIHRVIAESGSANANWALVPNPQQKAKQFASKLNCPVSPTPRMIKCLRELKNLTKMSIASDLGGQDWNPSLDNDFVTLERIQALDDAATLQSKLSHLQTIDLMMGTNGFDGQSFLPIPLYRQVYLSIINKTTPLDQIRTLNRNIYLKALKKLYSAGEARRVLDAVDFEYTYHDDPNNRNLNIKQSTDFMTDVQYLFPTFKALESHAFNNTISTTYQYEFNELFPFLTHEPWIDGALHAQEMPYVFGLPCSLGKYFNYTQTESSQHWPFTARVMKYWSNFVKTGNPNRPRAVCTEWEEYKVTTRKYLYLTSALTESRSYLHGRHLAFWSEYLPRVISEINTELKNDNSTCPTITNTGSRGSFILSVCTWFGLICCFLLRF